MWSTPFLIAAWLTVSFFPEQSESTSVILAEFSLPLERSVLLNKDNYYIHSLTSLRSFEIDSVFEVLVLEEDTVKPGTLIAVVTQRLVDREEYIFQTFNLVDTSGIPLTSSSDWFYVYLFANNLFETPSPVLSGH